MQENQNIGIIFMLGGAAELVTSGASLFSNALAISNYLGSEAKKTELIDPLITIISLAILKFAPRGTLIGIVNHRIKIYYPSSSQGGDRRSDGASRDQIPDLEKSIGLALKIYCPPKSKEMRFMLECAVAGLKKLGEFYKVEKKARETHAILKGYRKRFEPLLEEETEEDVSSPKEKKRDKKPKKKRERTNSQLESDELKHSQNLEEQLKAFDSRQFCRSEQIDRMANLLRDIEVSSKGKDLAWKVFRESDTKDYIEALLCYISAVNKKIVAKANWT